MMNWINRDQPFRRAKPAEKAKETTVGSMDKRVPAGANAKTPGGKAQVIGKALGGFAFIQDQNGIHILERFQDGITVFDLQAKLIGAKMLGNWKGKTPSRLAELKLFILHTD